MTDNVDMSLMEIKQAVYHMRAAAVHFEKAGRPEWVSALNGWADRAEPVVEQDEPEGAMVISMVTGGRVD